MPCGWRTMFSHILCESLNEPKALHLAHWQASVFWLPWAQQESAGWWAPPLAIPWLLLKEYMPSPTPSNCQIMRQQKTMELARALQACTEESGFPTDVVCDMVQELQWCMAPLLVLNGNEIVEASLLRPVEGENRTSPCQEKKPLSWAALNLTLSLTLNMKLSVKLNCPRSQSNWIYVST